MDQNLAMVELNELAHIHQAKLGDGGFFTVIPDKGSPASGDGLTPVTRRPWLDNPLGSFAFDEQDGIALPAVGAGFVPVLSFTVPNGNDGVINRISNNFLAGGFVSFSGDIVWQIRIDGKPVRNFSNIRAEKGTVAEGREISPIRLFSNQLVEYLVNHVANGALTGGQTICSTTGNFYPSQN